MLQIATKNDFNFFFSLYMHPQINPYLLYEVMDKHSFVPIYEALICENVLYKFVVENEDVGMCKLILHKYRDGHKLYVGGFAIDTKQGGKNYGYKMMQQIIDFAKQHSRNRIELSVSVENNKAISLYKKCGFEIEGRLNNFTYLKSENRFIDEFSMALAL